MMNRLNGYLISVVGTYVVAVILVSQFNIARVVDLGHSVGLSDRFSTTLHDLLGMATSYLPLTAIALLLAFLFTGLLLLRMINASLMLYALAGFVGMLAMHLILNAVFNIHAVAPTRSLPGLLSQAVAGAIGGILYFRLVVSRASSAT